MKSARPKWISTKIRWFSSFYIYKLIQLTHGILIKILHSLSTLNLTVIEIFFSVWTCLDKCGMSEKMEPFLNPSHHWISMHILYTDLYTFAMVFMWRICPPIQSFSGGGSFPWFHDLYEWSFSSFSWPQRLIQSVIVRRSKMSITLRD